MKKFLLLTLLFTLTLLADKVLYLSFDKVPQRVLKGEIFPITIKTLSIVKEFTDINYKLSSGYGVKVLDEIPNREHIGKYYYETFHFLATGRNIKLPDIEASLVTDYTNENIQYDTTILSGKKLNVITLNPKKNFSNIIADSFELIDYKTTKYDDNNNIVVIVAKAYNSNIKAMHFNNVKKQGIESSTYSYKSSKITYYVVINKELENFSFSYFDLKKNKFSLINIPIIVIDDSVVTQSDLKPKNQSHEQLKMEIAAGIALIAFIFILFRKKYVYMIFIMIPLGYIIYLSIPQKDVCIKKGSQLHLLPVHNGTIFETTKSQYNLPKEGKIKGFVKVKLHNNKIGWVKDEDICSY